MEKQKDLPKSAGTWMWLLTSCAATQSNMQTDVSLIVSYADPKGGTKGQIVQHPNKVLTTPLLYYQVCPDLHHDLG